MAETGVRGGVQLDRQIGMVNDEILPPIRSRDSSDPSS